jgi:hypothetical protein
MLPISLPQKAISYQIHFGQDGGKPHDGTLILESNTILTPFVFPVVQLSTPQARVVLDNNTIANSGSQKSGQILVDVGTSTATNAVQGRDNKISSSFDGAALAAMKLEHTTLTNR